MRSIRNRQVKRQSDREQHYVGVPGDMRSLGEHLLRVPQRTNLITGRVYFSAGAGLAICRNGRLDRPRGISFQVGPPAWGDWPEGSFPSPVPFVGGLGGWLS